MFLHSLKSKFHTVWNPLSYNSARGHQVRPSILYGILSEKSLKAAELHMHCIMSDWSIRIKRKCSMASTYIHPVLVEIVKTNSLFVVLWHKRNIQCEKPVLFIFYTSDMSICSKLSCTFIDFSLVPVYCSHPRVKTHIIYFYTLYKYKETNIGLCGFWQ